MDVDTAEMGAEILQSTGNERALLPWQRAAGVSGRVQQSWDWWQKTGHVVRSEALEMENPQRQPCSYTWASLSSCFRGQTPSEGDCNSPAPLPRDGGGETTAC